MEDDNKVQSLDGVKMETITINAATPDVLGKVMQEITKRVLSSIPEGTLDNIAKEVLSGKQVLRILSRGTYTDTVKEWTFADSAHEKIRDQMNAHISKAVLTIFNDAKFIEVLNKTAETIAKDMLTTVYPKMIATSLVSKMSNMSSVGSEQYSSNDAINDLSGQILKIVQTLNTHNIFTC